MSIISDLLNIFNLYQNLKDKKKIPEETIATRFVKLLESHGVHRNQIPKFIGHGLKVSDVKNDETLLYKLDEDILNHLCEKLAIRREWLDGVDKQIYPCHDFYKGISDFVSFIKSFENKQIYGILIAPENKINSGDDTLFILQEPVEDIGDKTIFRYHLCNNWYFSYWKSKCYLTACIASAWSHKIYIHGVYAPTEVIQKICYGEGFIGEYIYQFRNKSWYPEYMALSPGKFLDGIDEEKDNYGIISALKFWLELEEQGFMYTGIGNKKKIRKLFQDELLKQSH